MICGSLFNGQKRFVENLNVLDFKERERERERESLISRPAGTVLRIRISESSDSNFSGHGLLSHQACRSIPAAFPSHWTLDLSAPQTVRIEQIIMEQFVNAEH